MSTYELLIAIHILCAALWVGGGVTMHIFGRRALASGDRGRMLTFSQEADTIGTRFYAPLTVILLVAGILLVNEANYEHSDLWVTFGYAGWLISFVIGVGYYSRAAKQRDAIVASEGLDSDAFLASYKRVANVNAIELLILVLIMVDMAIKPG